MPAASLDAKKPIDMAVNLRLVRPSIFAFLALALVACSKSEKQAEPAAAPATTAEPAASAEAAAPAVADEPGTTRVIADEKGFTPNSITIAKGETATLIFTRTTDKTCARDIVFPELDINEPLPLDEPVKLEIPTDEARTLTFQCGMGMYKSSLVIQ